MPENVTENSVETRLKPVMVLVFSLKLAVATLLVAHLALPQFLDNTHVVAATVAD